MQVLSVNWKSMDILPSYRILGPHKFAQTSEGLFSANAALLFPAIIARSLNKTSFFRIQAELKTGAVSPQTDVLCIIDQQLDVFGIETCRWTVGMDSCWSIVNQLILTDHPAAYRLIPPDSIFLSKELLYTKASTHALHYFSSVSEASHINSPGSEPNH